MQSAERVWWFNSFMQPLVSILFPGWPQQPSVLLSSVSGRVNDNSKISFATSCLIGQVTVSYLNYVLCALF